MAVVSSCRETFLVNSYNERNPRLVLLRHAAPRGSMSSFTPGKQEHRTWASDERRAVPTSEPPGNGW